MDWLAHCSCTGKDQVLAFLSHPYSQHSLLACHCSGGNYKEGNAFCFGRGASWCYTVGTSCWMFEMAEGGYPCGVMVKAMDCRIVVSEFKLQLRHCIYFRINTLGKSMVFPYLPSYALNCIITVLLEDWLWHKITYKGWYAIYKPTNQPWDGWLGCLAK